MNSSKQNLYLHLNQDRRQKLYQDLQNALKQHHQGKDKKDTPALVYEALDAIALLLAGIFAGLHQAVGDDAAKTGKRYFRDASDTYVTHLQNQQMRPKEPIIVKPH